MHSDRDFTNFMNVFHSWRKAMIRMGVDPAKMRIELSRESFHEFETRFMSIATNGAVGARTHAAPNEITVAGIKIVMVMNGSARPKFVDPARERRIRNTREIAAAYRRDAEIVSQREWWQVLLCIHPDPRLKAMFLQYAIEFDARADAMERGE